MRPDNPYIEKLRISIRQECEHINPLQTPKDFLCFSVDLEKMNEAVSVSTIKRFFGYVPYPGGNFSVRILNRLSRFLGYKTYDDFCDCINNNTLRDSMSQIILSARTLNKGDNLAIEISNNDEKISLQVEYMGGLQFQVIPCSLGIRGLENGIITLTRL